MFTCQGDCSMLLSEDNSDILWVHEAVQLTVSLVAEVIRGQNGLLIAYKKSAPGLSCFSSAGLSRHD